MLHLDIDCFFAQVEQLDHPEYRGKPVIVGGRKSLLRIDPRNAVDDEHAGLETDSPEPAAPGPFSSHSFRVVGRGVVCTSSYEARARGVRTAMPLSQALDLCPEAICVPGNYARYSEVSKQVFEVVREFSPVVRMASLDEAYIDLAGLERWTQLRFGRSVHSNSNANSDSSVDARADAHGDAYTNAEPWPILFARQLRQAIRERTSIRVSVGIGPNAFIAKVASRRSKPDGLLYIPPQDAEPFARSLGVREVPGVGPSATARLHQFGYHTLDDVHHAGRSVIVDDLGNLGATLWERANGRDGCGLGDDSGEQAARKAVQDAGRRSISRETTFREDISDLAHLRSVLAYLTERACWTLRKERLRAGCVAVKVRFSDFTTQSHDHSLSVDPLDPGFTDHDEEIFTAVSHLLDDVLLRRSSGRRPTIARRRGRAAGVLQFPAEAASLERAPGRLEPVRLIGVRLSHLSDSTHRQWCFGEVEQYEKRNRLLRAADTIRDRFGFGSVAVGRSINLLESGASNAVSKGGKNGHLFQGKNHAIGR